MTLPAAVLLGGRSTAVPVARSLGAAGIPVYALGESRDPVQWSRYCFEFWDAGAGDLQERWLEWLLARAPEGAVVLTCSDDGVELVARHRAELVKRGLLVMEQNDELALALLDKERSYELAVAAGVPTPLCMPVRTDAELEAALTRIGFPCALKPVSSHLFARRSKVKLLPADNPDELRAAFAFMSSIDRSMILTELVPGPDDGFRSYHAYTGADGDPLCWMTKRKLRQYPAGGGTGTMHVTDRNDEVAELGARFLRHNHAIGLAGVEFKRDSRDGRLKLIECNYRFTGAIATQVAAGFDIPLFVYDRLTGRDLPELTCRPGVSTWDPIPDLRAVPEYRRRGELRLRRWLRDVLRTRSFVVARWDDPLPTVGFHLAVLRQHSGQLLAARSTAVRFARRFVLDVVERLHEVAHRRTIREERLATGAAEPDERRQPAGLVASVSALGGDRERQDEQESKGDGHDRDE